LEERRALALPFGAFAYEYRKNGIWSPGKLPPMKTMHCASLCLARNHRRAISLLAPAPEGQKIPSECIADCAWEIKSAWAGGTASTLALAGVVYAVWCRLPYGEWTRMWRSKRIGFAKRKGERLRVIGENLEGVSASISTHLPSAWNTLYHLARIDLKTLKKHVEDGLIHPGITEREAKELRAQFKGQLLTARKPNVSLRLKIFAEFVGSTLKDWTSAERRLVIEELSSLVVEIDQSGLEDQTAGAIRPTLFQATQTPVCLTAERSAPIL
jgi:hypothetical protein